MGYRGLRGKAVWFTAAYTTKAEATEKRDYEKKHGRIATIVTKYRDNKQKYYAVYSSN